MQDVAGGSLIDASAFREVMMLDCDEDHVEVKVSGVPSWFGIVGEITNEIDDFACHCVDWTSVNCFEDVEGAWCSWIGVV